MSICINCGSDDIEESEDNVWVCNDCNSQFAFSLKDRLLSELQMLEGEAADEYDEALHEFLRIRDKYITWEAE